MPRIQSLAPIYQVRDVRKTAEWYEKVLGFKLSFINDDESFGLITRNGHSVHLGRNCRENVLKVTANHIEFFIHVEDPEPFYKTAKAATQTQITELRMWPWGNLEFHVKDPDGALIRVGTYGRPARSSLSMSLESNKL